MSNSYDNWERLMEVGREQDREVALADSRKSSFRSISSSSRFGPDSSFHEQNPQLEAYNSADSRESSFRFISSSSRIGPDSSFHEQNPQLEAYNSADSRESSFRSKSSSSRFGPDSSFHEQNPQLEAYNSADSKESSFRSKSSSSRFGSDSSFHEQNPQLEAYNSVDSRESSFRSKSSSSRFGSDSSFHEQNPQLEAYNSADSRESSFRSISSSSRFGPDSSFHEQNPQLEAYNSNSVNLLGDKKEIRSQKIVIRVLMNDDKSRIKALKTVAGVSGVESASLVGVEGNQVEVVGEGIDPLAFITALRKKVAPADLVSVQVAKKLKEKKAKTRALQSVGKKIKWVFSFLLKHTLSH